MDFRIRPQAPQPVRRPRPLPAQQTAPLDKTPGAPRATERLGSGTPPQTRPLSLETNPDFQALRDQGKLTPEVMGRLRTLATQPLAEGIDRRLLLLTALRELADPERISQGNRETCAATVVQAKLAEDDPAEYLRLLSGLASPAGQVTLANGETLRRDPDWQLDVGRSLTGNLIQPAFMQFATGSYDNRTDTRATDTGRGKGLYAQEQTRLLNAVSGASNTAVFGNSPLVLDTIQQALARGQSVPVVLAGTAQAHSVLVERIQDGKVTVLDPSGQRRTLGLEAFIARLESASLPRTLVPAALLQASAGQQGSLAGWPDLWGAITGGLKAVAEGFEEHVAKPVVQAVKGGVEGIKSGLQAVSDHVIQPVANAVMQVGGALNEHVFQPLGQAFKPLGDFVLTPLGAYVLHPLYDYVLKPLVETVIPTLWDQGLQLALELKKQIEANRDLLMNIGAIACAVTPGLNVLSLVIAVGGVVSGGKRLWEGLRKGDWKAALGGAVELCTSAASAIGGPILSKAIGAGATAMARLATGLGKLANAGLALAEVCDEKASTSVRFGKVLSLVALGVGGGATLLGEQAEAAAAGFTGIAEKANGYYDRSVTAYRALLKGESNWKEILSQGVALAGDLQQDVRNDGAAKLLDYELKSATTYLNEGTRVWDGMTKADRTLDPELLASLYTLTSRVNRDVQNGWNPDVAAGDEHGKAESDRYAYMADLWRQTKGLSDKAPLEQVSAAWNYLKQIGASKQDEQLALWLRGWTRDLEHWGTEHGQEARVWAEGQIQEAWKWWSEQRLEAKPS
ncbi:MAG TPA: hypothetical protein V6D05_17670 [Stenomitos sp.]